MSGTRFFIHNREALRAEQSLLPFAQYLTRVLTSSGVVRRLSHESLPPPDGWIVFEGEGERGFAVRCEDLGSSLSPLQRALDRVRRAQAVVKGFGGPRAFPFTLSLRTVPPESWSVCKVEGVVNTVWCSASLPALEPPARNASEPYEPRVRMRFFALLPGEGDLAQGWSITVEELCIELPEVGVVGRARCRGGDMTLEVIEGEVREEGDAFEQRIPGVRLDLGEIEVRLSDLVGLRPGAKLDLGRVDLDRCCVRLGSTILAEGRFSVCDGKVTLTIESVV